LGPQFETPIWDPDLEPTFRTPILELMPNVISKKNPAMSLAKLNKMLVILMKLYWRPAMQVMYKVVLVLAFRTAK
jgi:hypothetical protein